MKKILIFFIILGPSLMIFLPSKVIAQTGASIHLSPNSGTFYVGSTFNVSILVDTGGQDINSIRVDLKFNPLKIQIVSPTVGKSFVSVWISQPSYSNVDGTATFQGGVPSPGVNSSSALVSTTIFRAISPGSATISILDSSQVLLNDGLGTDILSSLGRVTYEITLPPPEGPKVSSSTHPDQNKWYKNNSPTLIWEKEKGVTDFSYALDEDYQGFPDNIPEGSNAAVSYANLKDGFWYFHIKAKKGEVWGGVSHYVLKIDGTPPADFVIKIEPNLDLSSVIIPVSQPIISFMTTDNLSGMERYEVKVISFNKDGREDRFFVEATSPYKIPLGSGIHEIIVRAFDKAGNWRDSSEKLRFIPRGKFVIVKEGINIWVIFLPWWVLILIFGLVGLIALFIVLKRKGYLRKIYQLINKPK